MVQNFVNKKILLGLMTMLLILGIIVVSSFWPFILDPSAIGTTEFITDELIIMAIIISTMTSMLFVAQASNAQNPKSELAKAKVAFEASMKRINSHTALYQWIRKVLQPRDREDIARKGMRKLGVPFSVFGLTEPEIEALTVAQKYGDEFYKPLTKEQIKGVIRLKRKNGAIRFVSPNYYTSCKSMSSEKNLSEIAAGENEKKVLTVVFQLLVKMVATFVFSAILASLVRDVTQDGGSTAQAWMRFLSRMTSFTSSSFLGYTLGCKINDMDAFYISKRVEVHTQYLEDKTFVPQDEGKEAFKERCLKEEHALLLEGGKEDDER